MVYGLRCYYRFIGQNKRAIDLPKVKSDTRLPVILNRSELKELLSAPKSLKIRVMLALTYSAGLRGSEVLNLKISDIDFERKTIHICQGKSKKDRIVPLSEYISEGLKTYIEKVNPHIWLFNGINKNSQYCTNALNFIMRQCLKKTNIKKRVSVHCLRHSYATHLLEEGVNIQKIQLLLGHSEMKTTIIYLHIAQCEEVKAHSPLDTLYGFI